MNVPNMLSLFRLFVTAFFIVFIIRRQFSLALFLFILQALSDLMDGFFARRMGAKTNLGAYLDPMADKVMLAGSYIVLCVQEIIPLWLLVVILGRDLVITVGFLVFVRKQIRMEPVPSLLSKSATVFQMLTIVYVLWSIARPFDRIFFYITALLTILSGIQYIVAGWSVIFKKETA
jgi:cardiolipin synthase (CMP-forming)